MIAKIRNYSGYRAHGSTKAAVERGQVGCAFPPIRYIRPDQPAPPDAGLGQCGKPEMIDHGDD